MSRSDWKNINLRALLTFEIFKFSASEKLAQFQGLWLTVLAAPKFTKEVVAQKYKKISARCLGQKIY